MNPYSSSSWVLVGEGFFCYRLTRVVGQNGHLTVMCIGCKEVKFTNTSCVVEV